MIIIEIIFILAWLGRRLCSSKQLKQASDLAEVATVIFFICYTSSSKLFIGLLFLNVILLLWQIIRDIKKT